MFSFSDRVISAEEGDPMSESPFRPTFGGRPPLLAGRAVLLDAIVRPLRPENWRQQRSTLVTGSRGVGKTALLNEVEDSARELGWVVISETAAPGLTDRLQDDRLPRLLREHDPAARQRHITGASIANLGSVSTEVKDAHNLVPQIRGQLETLTDAVLRSEKTGVLITLDEIQSVGVDELRPLFIAIQHGVREDRPIAFVGAGLPDGVEALLQHEGLTFLRRARPIELDSLNYPDALEALGRPIRDHGRRIGAEALEYAAAASQGYPYLVQLVGDLAWNQNPEAEEITLEDVHLAAARAIHDVGPYVHGAALRELTDRERDYLEILSLSDGATRTAEIARHLGISESNAGNIRKHLILKGLIFAPDRGTVDFALPYMREYLRANGAETRTFQRRTFPAPPAALQRAVATPHALAPAAREIQESRDPLAR